MRGRERRRERQSINNSLATYIAIYIVWGGSSVLVVMAKPQPYPALSSPQPHVSSSAQLKNQCAQCLQNYIKMSYK